MEQVEILNQWKKFSEVYNFDLKEKIWEEKSNQFRNFWNERILPENSADLTDEELDKIIQILDKNVKGNIKGQEAVDKVMIAQGAWRNMFKEIKENSRLKKILNLIFTLNDKKEIEREIDNLYKLNEGRKNFLTEKNGNVINAMMFAYNPKKYIAIVSLNHRMKVINYFGFSGGPNFEEEGHAGKKIVLSNKAIIEGFKFLGMNFRFPRSISDFLYTTPKDFWNKEEISDEEEIGDFLKNVVRSSNKRLARIK